MTKGRTIRRRVRIFLCCEGESELSYGAFLQQLTNDHSDQKIHIVTQKLHPSGDPFSLAKEAIKLLTREREGRRGPITARAIMLDTDRFSDSPERTGKALKLLERSQFITICQNPDHEGFLLNHFNGHENRQLPPGKSMTELQKLWPEYRKNMAATDLQQQFTVDNVFRATGATPNLTPLLRAIGLSRS